MNPVVVKIPPPMMLLTSTQEAVNHPIFCPEDFCPSSLIGKRLLLSPVDWSRGFHFFLSFPTILSDAWEATQSPSCRRGCATSSPTCACVDRFGLDRTPSCSSSGGGRRTAPSDRG